MKIFEFIKTGSIENQNDFCQKIYLETFRATQWGNFSVVFKREGDDKVNYKTYSQLKGIHKLCAIYQEYLQDNWGGKISFENAKENLKYAIGYVRLATRDEVFAEACKHRRRLELESGEKMGMSHFNKIFETLQENYKVPDSFAKASLEEMMELIERVHELGRDRGWHNLILTNNDKQSMIEAYK